MKKKIIIPIAVVILAVIILSVVLLPRGNKTAKQNGTDASPGENSKFSFLTLKDADTETGYDESQADKIELSDSMTDKTVEITSGGTYIISGSLSDGQIIINAPDSEKVRLILNNVTLSSSTGAPIYVKSSDKTIITLAEGSENVLSDTKRESGDDNAVIYSETDLSINGTGTLTINALYNDGINCRDDLKLVDGTYIINAVDDGIVGHDSVTVAGGTYTIDSKDDGIKSSKSGNDSKGYVHITGGDFTINCGDDGIHAETYLYIENGTINITECYEGIEGHYITIDDGTISINSSDDGINAAKDSASSLVINGGDIYVNAEGDGIDSNGTVVINSGIVVVDGPVSDGDSGLDYDVSCTVNGGYIFIAGSSGMAEGFSSNSTQCGTLLAVTNGAAGDTVSLADSEGNVILSYTPSKKYGAVNISSPDMKTGETYTLYTGGTITGATELNAKISKGGTISNGTSVSEYTQSDMTYSDIKGGFGPGGNGGDPNGGNPNGGNRPGSGKFNPDDNSGDFTPPDMSDDERPGMPDGEMPSMPDGERPEKPDNNGTRPEKSDNDGARPEKPDETSEIS